MGSGSIRLHSFEYSDNVVEKSFIDNKNSHAAIREAAERIKTNFGVYIKLGEIKSN